MEGLFKNREVKATLVKLIILQLFLIVSLGVFQFISLNSIKSDIVDAKAGIVGKIIASHPELEGEIISSITKKSNQQEISKGFEILSFYGYTKMMDLSSEPIIYSKMNIFTIALLAILIAHLVTLIIILIKDYSRIFIKIREITLSIEAILKGNFNKYISEGDEGDFSILGHHFNNMSVMISKNLETLRMERTFLKDILSDISHQLKTPMSSLIMLNDFLIEKKQMDEGTRLDFLYKTRVQLNRMNWLTKSLLKIARLEANSIVFNNKEVYLGVVVEKALSSLSVPAEVKNIIISIADDNKIIFKGDEDWTSEAVLNIVKNCIEHTTEGGEIHIEFSSTPLSSTIKIRDNGEGISKSELPHIFERFYKGSNSVKEDSIGIGLAMSKSIIEKQGGEIKVKSEPGRGTEFNITFLKGVI